MMLFECFISEECGELLDIDVDFEYQCCEEVIQYIYVKYGKDCVVFVVVVLMYCLCGVLCEIGKVFGVDLMLVDCVVKGYCWFDGSCDLLW